MDDQLPSPHGMAPNPPVMLSWSVILATLAASVAVAGFAISNQSYWIDEAVSLIVATAATPAEAWHYMLRVEGSTIQMPIYQAYLFLWHKAFGISEWAMRASNIPWFVFGQLGYLVMLRHRPRVALVSAGLAAVCPMVWAYLDEARPYLMQYAAACWMVGALVRFAAPVRSTARDGRITPPSVSPPELAALALAFVFLYSSSLLGSLWAMSMLAALVLLVFFGQISMPPSRSARWCVAAPTLAAVLAISLYYAWTISWVRGGYYLPGATLLSIPYIAYELLGFGGLGAGKIALRHDLTASLAESAGGILPLAICYFSLGVFAALKIRIPRDRPRAALTVLAWAAAIVVPGLLIYVALSISGYRALPRHYIPALPALITALGFLITAAMRQKRLVWRVCALALPVLWLISSANLRWQAGHAKDDYRAASAIAKATLNQGLDVWWGADASAAFVYRTPVSLEKMPGRAWAMQAPSWDLIRFKFPPHVIVLSKPDIYDPHGAIARYAAENQFTPALTLQAFTIFTRHGEPVPQL